MFWKVPLISFKVAWKSDLKAVWGHPSHKLGGRCRHRRPLEQGMKCRRRFPEVRDEKGEATRAEEGAQADGGIAKHGFRLEIHLYELSLQLDLQYQEMTVQRFQGLRLDLKLAHNVLPAETDRRQQQIRSLLVSLTYPRQFWLGIMAIGTTKIIIVIMIVIITIIIRIEIAIFIIIVSKRVFYDN